MSAFEGFGYIPDGVQSAATKPVSGERIITSLERLDAIQDHGTKKGYEAGCRGSHCPGKEAVGMSCSQASIRYAGDMSYRRRVDAGLSAEAIWAEDQAAGVVMPKASRSDRRAESVYDGEQSTVEDSVEGFYDDREFEDRGADLVTTTATKPPRSPQSAPVAVREPRVTAEPAERSRGPKWAVRRVWVAVAPDGAMHGPFADQPEAVAFVGTKLPKPVPPVREKGTRRPITAEDRATFRRLHAEGVSTTKIGQQTGRAISVVARELLSMGLQSNGHRFGEKRPA